MVEVTINGFVFEMVEGERIITKIVDGICVSVAIPASDHILSLEVFLDIARVAGYTIQPPKRTQRKINEISSV